MPEIRSACTSSKTLCCMCWQGCGKVQDWRGKFWLLWAFSFCNLKLLSAPETLGSSSAIAVLYLSRERFGQQQKC